MFRRILKLLFIAIIQIVTLCSGTMAEDRPKTLEGKIVGGSRTDISNFPHAVSLYINCSSKVTGSLCGSSVLNQLILLTAAHCVQCIAQLSVTAYAGREDRKERPFSGAVRKSLRIIHHPNYQNIHIVNDIALILLNKELPLSNNIKRVIINMRFPKITKKTKAYVAGWGNIQEEPRIVRGNYLKKVRVDLVSMNLCRDTLGPLYPGQMCAGTTQSNANRPARGDSGNALITSDYQQLGIVSWRNEGHLALVIYTNVTYFYSWIKKTAKQLYCEKISY